MLLRIATAQSMPRSEGSAWAPYRFGSMSHAASMRRMRARVTVASATASDVPAMVGASGAVRLESGAGDKLG